MPNVWDEVDGQLEQGGQDEGAAAPAEPASPARTPGNVWDAADALAQADDGRKNARLALIFERSLRASADDHATIKSLARVTGLKADLVESQLPLIRKRAEAAQFDPDSFRRENPGLVDFLLQDPEGAEVVLRDKNLHPVIKAIRAYDDAYTGQALSEVTGKQGSFGELPFIGESIRRASIALEHGPLSPEEQKAVETRALELQSQAETPQKIAMREGPAPAAGVARQVGSYSAEVDPEGITASPFAMGLYGVTGVDDTAVRVKQEKPGIYQAHFEQKLLQNDYGFLGARIIAAKARGDAAEAWRLEKQAIDLEPKLIPLWQNAGAVEQIGLDAADVLGSNIPMMARAGQASVLAGGIVGGLTLAVTRNKDAARKAAGFAFKKAGQATAFLTSFELEMGSTYLGNADLKTSTGEPVSEEVRVGFAVAYGLVAATVETEALEKFVGMWGPLGDVVKSGGGLGLWKEKLLKDATFRAVLARAGKAWIEGAKGEIKEEVIQQIAEDVSTWGAKAWTAAGKDGVSGVVAEYRAAKPEETAAAAWDSARVAAVGTLALGASGAVTSVVTQEAMRDRDLADGNRSASIAKLPGSASARGAPRLVARLIEQETASSGEPVRAAYIVATEVRRLFQSSPDPEAALTELLGEEGVKQLEAAEAGANDGKIEVPLATYLEKWGTKILTGSAQEGEGVTIAQALAGDTAVRPGGKTVRQRIQADAEIRQGVVRLKEEYLKENAPAPVSQAERDLVDAVEGQLAATGVYDPGQAREAVALARALLRTQAEVAKVDPDALFSHYVFKVDNESANQAVARRAGASSERPVYTPKTKSGERALEYDDARLNVAIGTYRDRVAELEKKIKPYEDGTYKSDDVDPDVQASEQEQVAEWKRLLAAARDVLADYEGVQRSRTVAAPVTLNQPGTPQDVIAKGEARILALWEEVRKADESLGKGEGNGQVEKARAAAMAEIQRWQKRLAALAPQVVAVRSLSSETLLRESEFGGIVAPASIASPGIPGDMPGEVSLIAVPSFFAPQRSMALSEFAAAVVPEGVDPRVREALTKAGVPVFSYPKDLEGAREEAIRRASEDRKVLFQRAFHGGPHRNIDRFLLSKIGTGEGAQVYGWGLYFAQNRKVAEEYRENLSRRHGVESRTTWDFIPRDVENPIEFYRSLSPEERAAWSELHSSVGFYAAHVKDAGERTIALFRDIVAAQTEEAARFTRRAQDAREAGPEGWSTGDSGLTSEEVWKETIERYERRAWNASLTVGRRKAALDLIEKYGLVAKPPVAAGQVYRVEVPENDVLLDYDAPFARQPEKVKAAVRAVYAKLSAEFKAALDAAEQEVRKAAAAEQAFVDRWQKENAGGPYRIDQEAEGSWLVSDGDGKPQERIPGEQFATPDDARSYLRERWNDAAFDKDRQPFIDAWQAAHARRDAAGAALARMDLDSVDATGARMPAEANERLTGYDLYSRIVAAFEELVGADTDEAPKRASLELRAAGVPGLRYKDQGSRAIRFHVRETAAADGFVVEDSDGIEVARGFTTREEAQAEAEQRQEEKATRNFVVWDEDTLSIAETFYQPAWHGSPHKNVDRFRLNKIGTGEGAQAFGWGLYFAEARDTAEMYRATLSTGRLTIDGRWDWKPGGNGLDPVAQGRAKLHGLLTMAVSGRGEAPLAALASAIRDLRMRAATTEIRILQEKDRLASVEEQLRSEQGERRSDVAAQRDAIRDFTRDLEHELAVHQAALAFAEELAGDTSRIEVDSGQTYLVDLPGNEELLDYDATLDQQPAHVQTAIRGVLERLGIPYPDGKDNPSAPGPTRQFLTDPTGSSLYDMLSTRLGSPQRASEALDAAGIPGLRYLDGASRRRGEGSRNFVIWNEDRVALMERMYQPRRALTDEQRTRLAELDSALVAAALRRSDELRRQGEAFPEDQARQEVFGPETPTDPAIVKLKREWLYLRGYDFAQKDKAEGEAVRGYVDMMRQGLRRIFSVVFTDKADLSTFLHESGHVFLDIMGDLAERPGAAQRTREDWQATLKWLGVKSRHEIQTEHHEKFARGFEAYLLEGRAPSLSLVGAFQRFKLWLKGIYKAMPPEQIDDSIRLVFDRMLATDAELENMKRSMGADRPLITSPADLGGDAAAFKAYLDDRERSFATAGMKAQRSALKAALRATEAWWKEQVEALRKEAELEFDALPAARAWRFLKRGDAGGDPALATMLDIVREEATGKVRPKLSEEAQSRLDEIAADLDALEIRRKVAKETERLVAAGMPADQAETSARRQVEAELANPLRVPSATRAVHFLAAAGEDGELALVAPFRGEVPEGHEVRSLELPAWLSAEDYLADPVAWRFAWAALARTDSKLVGSKVKYQRLEASGEVVSPGIQAPEGAQRLVADYFRRAFAAFPEDVPTKMKGWALGRLLSGSFLKRGTGGFTADLRAQVAKWLSTPPAERKFDEPLSPRQFEILSKNAGTLARRDAIERGKKAPAGKAVKPEDARPEAAPAPSSEASEEIAAEILKLREERDKITGAAFDDAVKRVRVKIDLADVVRTVGESVAKERFRGLTTPSGGTTFDELAQILAGVSGADLAKAMLELPDRRGWADEVAERRMTERHPDAFAERKRLAEEAAAALHNQGTSDWLLKELVALKRRSITVINPETGKEQVISAKTLRDASPELAALEVPIEAIRQAAQDLAADEKIGEVSPARALAAERAAAERAFAAAARGDFKLAYVEQQKRLLNHYLFRAIEEAREDREKLENVADRMTDPKRRGALGLAGKVFRDAADSILEALGFKDPASPAEIAERKTIPEWTAELEKQGIMPGFAAQRLSFLIANPPATGATAKGKPIPAWRALTVADARLVLNALVQLYTAARDMNKVRHDEKLVDIGNLIADIGTEASRLPPKPPPPGSDSQKGPGFKAKQRLEGIDAALTDPELMWQDLGPTAHRFFWGGYLEHRQIEDELAEQVLKWIEGAWETLPESMRDRRFDILPADVLAKLPYPADVRRDGTQRDRSWLWMVALNMGNRSNMERLLGGYEWDEQAVREVLDATLTAEEWDFIESVWKLLDEQLYPKVATAYEKVNGIKPEKIEALPFTLSSGRVIRGGYFPARYDPIASRLGENQREEALTKLYGQKAGQYSVSKSFTQGRVKHYEDVINLQWGEVPRHVGQVIHYVAFDSFVRDAGRVLADGRMMAIVQERLGMKFYPQLEQWLRVVATDQADAVPEHLADVQWALSEIRSRFVMQTLGLSLTVAIGDLTNPLVAIASGKVKARYGLPALAWGLKEIPAMLRGDDELHALIPELKHRRDGTRRRMKHELAQIGMDEGHGFHAALREIAWTFMEFTDLITSTVIAKAAFEQAGGKAGGKAAIAAATHAVQRMLPSHDLAEQPAFLRDKRGVGAVLAFYGYFSKLYNVNREIWRPATIEWMEAEGGLGKARAAGGIARAAGRTLAVIVVTNLLAELLSGRGPEDDEKWGEWAMRKILAAPFTWIPLVGQAAEFGVNAAISKLLHGKAQVRQFSARASPAAAAMERLARILSTVLDSHAEPDERILGILAAYGLLANVPVGSSQVQRTVGYVTSGELARDAKKGKVAEVAGGLAYGERRRRGKRKPKQPKNPGTLIQDILDGKR